MWLAIIGTLVAISSAFAAPVTIRQITNDARYWPPVCTLHQRCDLTCPANPCILTGLGGILIVWISYVDANPGRSFVVRGVCASACEIAYQRAKPHVVVEAGAQLIVHDPSIVTR